MRVLDVTVAPPLSLVPDALELIASSPHLVESRLHEWNPQGETSATLFYVCEGDRDPVVAGLARSPLVADVSASPLDEGRFGLLVQLDVGEHPLVRRVFETVTGTGLIVRKPVVYREGQVHARLLGSAETLRRLVGNVPAAFDVTVERLGRLADHPAAGVWGLSPRQREALRAAVALGYYEHPRGATHGDVARALGCSSSTASEHLQKAEAELVRGAVAGAVDPGSTPES